MKFIAIIPARYASTRFPGKPLAVIGGVTMIERVYRQTQLAVDRVVVATDDDRIYEAVRSFGGEAIMTGTHHQTGTDRIFEAYTKLGERFDVVINVQGDEPFIDPKQIQTLKACFDASQVDIATLVKPFPLGTPYAEIENPNSPKVVVNLQGEAMYFSRSPIPYLRGVEQAQWSSKHTFLKHVGLYAYRSDVLARITSMSQAPNELNESLEQLRWLENGLRIRVGTTDTETIAIDTPEDLKRAELFLAEKENQ